MRTLLCLTFATLLAAPAAAQDMEAFTTGPVFADFGPHASIEGAAPIPAGTTFTHAFDVADEAESGRRNSGFEGAARFINMHVAGGVARENIRLAVVVHGGAVRDLLTGEARAARELAEDNPTGPMVREMLDGGTRFIVCGQSMAGIDVTRDELIPGVEIALSAMTAHALLQQEGYTLNPF